MYYKNNELDLMPGIYKCYGDIKYLRFKIRLDIIKSSMIPLSNIEEQEPGGIDPQYNEREEFEFSWNEKIFSPREFKHYTDIENCHTSLEQTYHDEIAKLISSGTTSPRNRLFTYTTKDTIPQSLHRNILYKEEYRRLFPREDKHSSLTQRPLFSEKTSSDCVSLPCKNIVDYNPSDEVRIRNRSLFSGYETMYIAADLTDKSLSETENVEHNEHLLGTIKWNKATRTLTISPDFANFNTPGYKIDVESLGDTRYVYRYWVLHVSQKEDSSSVGKMDKLTNELTASFQNNLNFSLEFEVPYDDVLNLFVFAEIKKAVGFQYDNLFVQYFIHLPNGWSVDSPQLLSGITQQSRLGHLEDTVIFSYLFEVKLILLMSKMVKNNENVFSALTMPQLFFEICSLDSWKRLRVEGYAWTPLPTKPGHYNMVLNTWRTAPTTKKNELKRFFIGSDPQISDFTYPGMPANHQGNLLSRYGFESISSGDIHLELNMVQQTGRSVTFRKGAHLLDKTKTVMLMNSVNHILEAFKKARERMLIAREPVSLFTDS